MVKIKSSHRKEDKKMLEMGKVDQGGDENEMLRNPY